jgi:hypothetical protein
MARRVGTAGDNGLIAHRRQRALKHRDDGFLGDNAYSLPTDIFPRKKINRQRGALVIEYATAL